MNDVQKQLDELIALKNTLINVIDSFQITELDKLAELPGSNSTLYQEIAKYYRAQNKKVADNFAKAQSGINQQVTVKSQQCIKKSQNLIKESQRLDILRREKIKKSQRLAKESRQLAREGQLLGDTKHRLLYEYNQLIKESHKLNKKQYKLIQARQRELNIENKKIINYSINVLQAALNNINNNIDNTTLKLTEAIAIDRINNLCATEEYQNKVISTYLLPNIVPVDKHIVNLSLLTIKAHCDWHFPGLQINPSTREWVDCMVTADPLYIIQRPDNQTLPAILNTYPSEYIQRLRVYNIDQDFSILPQQQFGCIACCNFLNSYDLVGIKNLLATYNTLLRPGGKLVCNLQFLHNTTVSDIVEENYFNYTLRLVIQNIFNDIGYNILSLNEMVSGDVITMLITVEKFGTLTTAKAHQVLGSIIEK